MWSDRLLPTLLQTPQVSRLRDIPLDPISPEAGIWCAYYDADVSFVARDGELRRREHTFAGLSADPRRAQFFCMMEAAERRCGLSAEVMGRLSFRDGTGPGWEEFSPYTEAQWHWNAQYSDGQPEWRSWATGLLTGRRVAVPSDSLFPWWRSFSGRTAPLPEGDGGGFAAGFDWESEAHVQRALAEVIERDACMLSWRLESWPARGLPAQLLPDTRLLSHARREGLRAEFYDIGDPQLAPVVIALLSRENSELVIGASCDRDMGAAAAKALREAYMLRDTAALLSRRRGKLTADEIEDSADHLVYAWRHSGAYLDWYRRKARRGWPASGHGDRLAERACRVFGDEPLVVDVTHPSLTPHRIRVLRVLQPHAFRKEYRHVFRYRGGRRLRRLGASSAELNLLPHAIG